MIDGALRQENRGRPKPGSICVCRAASADGRCGENADERSITQGGSGGNHGAIADERAFADFRGGDRHQAMFNLRRAQGHVVGDKTFIPDIEQIRRGGGGR